MIVEADETPPSQIRIAVAALLILAALIAVWGQDPFNTTWDSLSLKPDDAMRIVEMRDLAEGQGWFDLRQLRLGMEAPVEMHWSRLVDLPLVVIRSLAETVVEPAQADRAAAAIWPFFIAFGWAFLMLRICWQLAGPRGVSFGFLVVAPFSLIEIELRPGRVDHHELQLVLLLAVISLAISGRKQLAAAAGAGAVTAISLAIGLESLPVLTIAGVAFALNWVLDDTPPARRAARAYGIGLAAGTVAVMLATLPRRALTLPLCDQLSLATGALLVVAGSGLAIGTVLAVRRPQRIVALGVTGAAVVALVYLAFPHCLGGPYGTLSPAMQDAMAGIFERRNIAESLAEDREIALYRYVARPAVGLAGLVLASFLVPRGQRFGTLLVLSAALLATAIAMLEERGHRLAQSLILFGGVILVVWAGSWRGRVRLAMPVALAGLLVLMTPLGYALLPSTAAVLRSDPESPDGAGAASEQEAEVANQQSCVSDAEMAPIALLPPGRVLTHPYVGNFLLLKTRHASIGSMLHRNEEGYLAALRLQGADAETARHLLSRYRVDYLAFCSFQGEREAAADTFYGRLLRGDVPDWLTPLPGGEKLRIYRFTPGGS